ncbi:unnamed protein product [Rhodiola kirilowii]
MRQRRPYAERIRIMKQGGSEGDSYSREIKEYHTRLIVSTINLPIESIIYQKRVEGLMVLEETILIPRPKHSMVQSM